MVDVTPVVYRSGLTDSGRWRQFPLRPDDIIISAPSKCGTTWLQMICALLVFRTEDLPVALTTVSPWLDMRLRPLADVTRALEAQRHRRFIKTHTPLDGLPRMPGVSYVVVGRDPRDVAVSMDHHRGNLDDRVIHRLLTAGETAGRETAGGGTAGGGTAGGGTAARPQRPAGRRERVLRWIHDERPATESLDSLRAVVHQRQRLLPLGPARPVARRTPRRRPGRLPVPDTVAGRSAVHRLGRGRHHRQPNDTRT
jgi:aryl sulfotransferase